MTRTPAVLFAFLAAVAAPSATAHEAGFTTLAPVTFWYSYGGAPSRLELTTSEARIFYSFEAADADPAHKPLFVFFNGGPGSATTAGLMSLGTSRYALDNRIDSGGGELFLPNAASWTRLGNLLYVDAREAGFSYDVSPRASDATARFQEFDAQNFGTFVDGADFIRVLLRFLARHAELRASPVVIVGESYGGTRATVVLHELLNYADYGDGVEMFQDPALAAEIQAHFDAVFPDFRGRRVPPDVIARQFGNQVLIQPTLSMGYQQQVANALWQQPGSVLYQIGEAAGVPFGPRYFPDPYGFVHDVAGRDYYMYTKPKEWLNGFFNNAGRLLRTTRTLSLVTGTDVTAIPEMYAAQRAGAYRAASTTSFPDPSAARAHGTALDVLQFLSPALAGTGTAVSEPGDVQAVFGRLAPWDHYYLTLNADANYAFYFYNVAALRGYEVDYNLPRFGRMFLKNVVFVRTFVTNAALDLVVYTPAVAPALALHTEILTSARQDPGAPAGAARPGTIVLDYRADAYADVPSPGTRVIRFPGYARSCHAVALTQPEDLLADVWEWLGEAGVVAR